MLEIHSKERQKRITLHQQFFSYSSRLKKYAWEKKINKNK
jgi:hypothetical protein